MKELLYATLHANGEKKSADLDGDEFKECQEHHCAVPAGSGGGVPKPIPYEYMPEGYPRSEMGMETVLEEQTITLAVMEYGECMATFPATGLEIGKTYTMVYDGTAYECTAIDFASVQPQAGISVAYGNLGGFPDLPGVNTDAPFAGFEAPDGSISALQASADQAGDHTFAIYEKAEVITPIAEKFLPFCVVNISEDENGTLSCNMTGTEIYEALLNRIPVMGFCSDGLSCSNSGVDAVFDDSGAFTHCEVCSYEVYPDGTVGGGGK